MQFWMPTIIAGSTKGLSSTTVGFLSMIPWFFAIAGMLLWARHSDKMGERKFHVMLPFIALLVVIVFIVLVKNPTAKYIALIFFVTFAMLSNAPFNTMPAMFLSGEAAAVGFALISSVANICNMITSTIVGVLKSKYGDSGAFVYFAVLISMAIVLTALLPKTTGKELYSSEKA
jgi:Sugar phosphate permease